LQYSANSTTPTELTWKRDIYRELDLTKEKNAALYYPEEPLGDRVNFFTLIFNLILENKITAYEYRLDGNELFTKDNVLDVENMLDKFYIYYEKEGNKYVVQPADIPSILVTKYYIKESNYVEQGTSNYSTRVTAICPVLMNSDGGTEPTPYPMFWLNYDEISPYLVQTQVMTSSYNNTSNLSLDDYFLMRKYDGTIYKTSNLRNQPLAEYCENDSALIQEQLRIEKQLTDVENSLWGNNEEAVDTEAGTTVTEEKSEPKAKRERTEREPKPVKEPKPARQPASSNERISVRR
jgi:gliding motility associated protien GldN